MKNEKILRFGFALLSAAALSGTPVVNAQEATIESSDTSGAVIAVHETAEHDENDKPKQKRKEVRIERRGPERRVHIEERNENGDITREFHSDDADDADRARPGRRIQRFEFRGDDFNFPKDKFGTFHINPPNEEMDVIIRRLPKQHREMRFEMDAPSKGAFAFRPAREPMGKLEHVDEAIRHLREAGLDEPAKRLEAERERLRKERPNGGSEELQRLRKEHEALKSELRKLKEDLKEGKESKKAAKRDADDKE